MAGEILAILGGELKERMSQAAFTPEAALEGIEKNIRGVVNLDKEIVNIVRSGTGNATLYTTPSDEDFFLTGAFMNVAIDDSTGAIAYVTLTFTMPTGETQTIKLSVQGPTLASGFSSSDSDSFDFQTAPIKLARSSAINMAVSGGTGYNATIFGVVRPSIKKII